MGTPTSLREAALPRLHALIEEAARLASNVTFNPQNRQHLIAISLLGSMLEQANGILVTLQNRNLTSAFIIVRSALEAYVDLRNISDDADYVDVMHAIVLDQQKR